MVWICEVCNGKNNNSSVKCRVYHCHAPKPKYVIEVEQKIVEKSNIRDYCPTCKTHQDFVKVSSKNEWACQRCHKKYKFKGKPVPEFPKTHTEVLQ